MGGKKGKLRSISLSQKRGKKKSKSWRDVRGVARDLLPHIFLPPRKKKEREKGDKWRSFRAILFVQKKKKKKEEKEDGSVGKTRISRL